MADEIPFRKDMVFEYGVPRELYPGILRIVANNPGPFTYKGTNTYILGQGNDLALIDPGPEDDQHFNAMMGAIGKKRLTTILVTHTHRDHVDGLPRLQKATGAKTAGFGRIVKAQGSSPTVHSGTEFVDEGFKPDILLRDSDRFQGDGYSLTAVHTPGHAPDHLCFALDGTKLFISGDHVMSWNTSVVAPPEGHMGDYMQSLDKLMVRNDEAFLPGHGGRLYQPRRVVKAFIVHRQMRERAILDCIKEGHATVDEIVPIVYRGLDSRLVRAASLSVAAHVEHLIEQRLLTSTEQPLLEARLSPV